MKNLYTIIMVAAGLLMSVACMKETVEPEQRISGEFVPSPDNPLDGCFSYVVFQKGYYAVKLSNNFYYFAENKLWNCNERNFSSLAKIPYYISGGELFLEGKSQGAISLKGDILTINGRKYEKSRGFTEKHFFKIVPASTTVTSDYSTHSISVPYTITSEYPATHAEFTVSCKESWVENVSVSADKITFNVQENNSRTQRNANLDLILPYAETVRVNLTQSYASSSLSFTPSSQSAPYTSGSYSFICAITNPRVGVNVTAVSQSEWITDVVVSGNTVSYKVSENNSGTSRTGRISLAYGDYASRIFYVYQSWSSSSVTLTPSSQNTDYTSGAYSFQYAVTNPREGVAVTAVSLSEWVTDVVVSGNTINYKVTENNSGVGRYGIVRLSYSSYASKDFIIIQSGKPVQTLSLNKSDLALLTGTGETLVATVEPTDAPLQWSSDNTSVAIVNQLGLVSAVGNGTAVITVSAANGKSASCIVTVTTLVTGIKLNKTSLILSEGAQDQLEATITPSTASDKSVTWSSDDTSVATVDPDGKISAVSKGTTTITAKSNDGSGCSASCIVGVFSFIPMNLSANGNANCYVVSSSGDYCFLTTQGNSSTPVGNVSSAVVLWESYGTSVTPSVGSIINNVLYVDNAIYFSTLATLKNGNAVIAAKNASGEILWSWHIWVCNGYDPVATAQEYYDNAGTMMDRNLGATSATPGDVGALGMLYQWGRKDPFLSGSSISSRTKAKSTLSAWPSAVSSNSSNGTIAYAVKNPTTFIKYNSSNYDWYYTGSTYTDNNRWKSSKTIYDPCPPGWRVPDGGDSGVWAKALGSSSATTWDSTNYGMNFSGKFGSADTIWYPAAGYLYYDDGSLFSVGSNGYWWSCSPNGYYAYRLCLYSNGHVYPSYSDYRALGLSVRCQKED